MASQCPFILSVRSGSLAGNGRRQDSGGMRTKFPWRLVEPAGAGDEIVNRLGGQQVACRVDWIDPEVGGQHHDSALAQIAGDVLRLCASKVGVSRDGA